MHIVSCLVRWPCPSFYLIWFLSVLWDEEAADWSLVSTQGWPHPRNTITTVRTTTVSHILYVYVCTRARLCVCVQDVVFFLKPTSPLPVMWWCRAGAPHASWRQSSCRTRRHRLQWCVRDVSAPFPNERSHRLWCCPAGGPPYYWNNITAVPQDRSNNILRTHCYHWWWWLL